MSYKIPLFDLNFDEKEEQAVLETIQSKWISTGPKTAAFEEKFASMLHAKHAVALSNCTVSLHLALKLADVQAGDEVICPHSLLWLPSTQFGMWMPSPYLPM